MSTPVDQYVKYNSEFKVLICCKHKYCIKPTGIQRHFQDYHQKIPLAIRKEIIQYGSQLSLQEPNMIGTANKVILDLAIYEKGFQCKYNGCDECTTTERSMISHCRTKHNWVTSKGIYWKNQAIQTFFQGENSK